MSRSFEVDGMLLKLRHLHDAGRDGAVQGLHLATEHILGVANDHVPHEEGTLERSGKATVDPETLRGCVSYDTPYAVEQHEDLRAQHDAGRTAKYLENAFNSEAGTVRALIVEQIKQKLGAR